MENSYVGFLIDPEHAYGMDLAGRSMMINNQNRKRIIRELLLSGSDANEQAWQIVVKDYMLRSQLMIGKDFGNGEQHGKSCPGNFFGFHLTLVLLHYRGY
jgi:hypothetical protein